MTLNKTIEDIKNTAKQFGMYLEDSPNRRHKQNAVWRNNTKEINYNSSAYFGIIREGEAISQSYSDLCLVFFPNVEDNSKLLMALAVGSEGFRNDYEIASQPGLRRSFLQLLPNDGRPIFCKRFLTDTTTQVEFDNDGFSIERYVSFLLIGVVVDTREESDMTLINGWLARYSQMRCWDNTKALKKEIYKAIDKARIIKKVNQVDEITHLLNERKYVVIEGAPGVGKTHTATILAKEYDEVFFTQFHAGTTYADFVYGILPKLQSKSVEYLPHKGVLLKAMEYARENEEKKVLLIIDEINRANLASVLGEVFYLFEPKRDLNNNYEIEVGDCKYSGMPPNLFVLGTMNTADRSLAVVDYALRRRFAWYKLEPLPFEGLSDFGKALFDRMARIFEDYATDMELNLQPGASYFMGSSEDEIKNRMRFELMPLIKEYLLNGFMKQAEQPLDDYFFEHINCRIFN